MPLFDLIERLQKKPEETRRRLALMVAGGVTALVVVVWGVTLSVRLGTSVAPAAVEEALPTELTPLESVKRSFSESFDTLRALPLLSEEPSENSVQDALPREILGE